MDRKCSKCGITKPIDEFEMVKVKDRNPWRRSWCRECMKAYHKARPSRRPRPKKVLVTVTNGQKYKGRRSVPCVACGRPSPDGYCPLHGM